MRMSRGEKIFHVINNIILFVIVMICLYPIVYIAASSLSSPRAIASGSVFLWPKEFDLGAYKAVFKENDVWLGYANSFYYMISGTLVSLVLMTLGAYPISKKDLKGRGVVLFLIVFTMWFSGGIVPIYLNFVDLGLLNTRASIILGFACESMYVIILKTSFEGIPDSLEEAALIDGAGHFRVLWQIYLPLSKAALVTVGMMCALAKWNGYFWSMILLSQATELQPLQVVLKRMLFEVTTSITQGPGADSVTDYSLKMMSYALMMVSMIPMFIIYPFVSKYFEKGIMLGSVKG